jgi:hypothetical protein
LLLVVATIVSCGGGAGNDADAVSPANVRVTVRNDTFYDATVYLLRGAARRRVGLVTATSTATFVLPRQAVAGLSEIRFGIDFIGRRDNTASETILAEPGDHIELIIR